MTSSFIHSGLTRSGNKYLWCVWLDNEDNMATWFERDRTLRIPVYEGSRPGQDPRSRRLYPLP